MRNTFADLILAYSKTASQPPVVMTGDLGFSVLEPLERNLPAGHYLNVGINEALMTSMAAAVAADGFKVFTYSIAPFNSFRCLEQIRNDIAYHNLDVTIAAIGAGYGYGTLGPTHHALEDVAALWSLPNMTVLNPADVHQVKVCFEKVVQVVKGPKYVRLGKGREGLLGTSKELPNLIFEYSEGADLSVVCTGHILEEVLKANEMWKAKGLSVQVLSLAQLKPFPSEALLKSLTSKSVLAVEELNPYGGACSQIASVLLNGDYPVRSFRSLSTADRFAKVSGSLNFQRESSSLGAHHIFEMGLRTVKSND